MKLFYFILLYIAILQCCYAPPVTQNKEQDSEIKDDLEDYMEYHRYLKEVVQALESDPEFRERLEKADQEDVKSGKIAEQLDFVNHNVRSKLNEIKRRELVRLRHLATKQYELTNDLDFHSLNVPSDEHLDHKNPHTFEIEDLKKLIKKTTADLEEIDKKRRQEFKEYEMQKEFEKHQKLESLDETHKKEYQEQIDKEEKAKKKHQPLLHPVTKEQLLELWKKVDELDAKDFNPRVFFMMHDVDGNGVWDADEVKALFIKELDKMYGPNGPNKDPHERAEEMERMREHVFQESDTNRDGLIDFSEFMLQTKRTDFQKDEGWQPIDENQIYTHDEYQQFERRRIEEIRYLQERGMIDAHGRPIPGAGGPLHPSQQGYQYQHQVPGQVPVQMQQHPGHSQQQYYQQAPMQPQMQAQYPQPHPQGQAYQQAPPNPQDYHHPAQQQYPPQGQMPQHAQVQQVQSQAQGSQQVQAPIQAHAQPQVGQPIPQPAQPQVQPQVPQAQAQLAQSQAQHVAPNAQAIGQAPNPNSHQQNILKQASQAN